MLFIRSLKRHRYLLFVYFAILWYSCRVWEPSCPILPYPLKGFVDMSELIMPLLAVIPMTFILNNNYEIELSLTCGVSTAKLLFTEYLTTLIYTLLPLYAVIALHQYKEYFPEPADKVVIPIVIPENYKVYMLISVTVTVLFVTSLSVLLRVLMRNCFTPVVLSIFIHELIEHNNIQLHTGKADIRGARYDLYLSNYFLGDGVPESYGIEGMEGLWTCNRLIFFGISLMMLFITYLLLRREKLHESYGG
ncbi:MAG: hypothetical protein IJ519_03940 [Clostridia bacterium]|nr:hypothetical protein [Clostridia bacterium]